ncbi:MAG: 16S rRNA (uracil(1498)-N(3))-methyltransferase [Bacteroidia bacterium]|nr:16S rRNA (uracil(1498)-N(3))-methyltransferase [Bacteroidia bacterium]
MHHFFSREIDNDLIRLDEEESRHCVKVMRLGIGSEVLVMDGLGKLYKCEVRTTGKRVELNPLEVLANQAEPVFNLTLAVSPTKSADRMEWMLEKLVEVGIQKLVFIKSEKGERSRLNTKRLHKKAVSALKQSGNLWLPTIETEVGFKDFVTSDSSGNKFIAHCFDKDKVQIDGSVPQSDVTVMIGPEGDFSEREIELAQQNGYAPLALGLPRYRTETAALVACTLLNHFYVTLAK